MKVSHRIGGAFALGALCFGLPAAGALQEGVDALRKGDYDAAKELRPLAEQARDAVAAANAWTEGEPMPRRVAAAGASGGGAAGVTTAAATTPAPSGGRAHVDKCTATGSMGGDKFTASHCAASFYNDQNSVAIWFNEDPITTEEATDFAISAHAEEKKGGKPRTLVAIMFCPGGGAQTANPAAVKTIDFSTNSAKSPFAGVQWTIEAGKDFKVDKMSGDVKPGGVLVGHVVGTYGKTSFDLAFDVALPAKEAAAGIGCGK